jgi:4-hydroxybenzoate-CoA ligase
MREKTYNAVAELLDRNVAEGRGNKVAFIDRRRRLTYSELQADSCRVANLLTKLGVRREQRVAMIMLDTVEFPIVFLGAMRAGAVPVPLNTLLTPEQYAYMLKDSRARALFVSAPLLKAIEPILPRLSDLEAVVVVGEGAASPHADFARALANMPATFETV